MNTEALTHKMGILFSVIFIAYFATKVGLLPKNANKPISSLILNVTCPATILHSMLTGTRSLGNGDVVILLLLGMLAHGIFILAAQLMTVLPCFPKDKRGVYRSMIVQANVGFLGFPLIRSIFGSDGMFIASIYNIAFNLVTYTYGTSQLASRPEDKKVSLKMFTTPVMICSMVGLVLYLLNLTLPEPVLEVLSTLDAVTSPASMVVIGCALASIPLKQVFTNWRIYAAAAVRLIVCPVAVWLVLRPFTSSQLIFQVIVTLAALPSATNITLLSSQYDGDVATASSGLFMTTILSLVTLPVLLNLLF